MRRCGWLAPMGGTFDEEAADWSSISRLALALLLIKTATIAHASRCGACVLFIEDETVSATASAAAPCGALNYFRR